MNLRFSLLRATLERAPFDGKEKKKIEIKRRHRRRDWLFRILRAVGLKHRRPEIEIERYFSKKCEMS